MYTSIAKFIDNSLLLHNSPCTQAHSFLEANALIIEKLTIFSSEISYYRYKNQIDYLFDLNEYMTMFFNENKMFYKDNDVILEHCQQLKEALYFIINK